MSSRTERFHNRKKILRSINKECELVSSKQPSEPTPGSVDKCLIEKILIKQQKVTILVSEEEVKDSLTILENKFTKDKYDALFMGTQDVLIDQLLSPLKLSRSDLMSKDRYFVYNRENYTKSPKSAGGDGDSFSTSRDRLKDISTNEEGKIKDTYTGKLHGKDDMDLDHIKSLKDFHDDGGFMLSEREKRDFAADPDNHAFTHKSINRSKAQKDLNEFADDNPKHKVDKRRTKAAHERAIKASEKYVPSGSLEKTVFVAKRATTDGVKIGASQGSQQAVAILISEFISATFREVKDIFENGLDIKDFSWIESLKFRLLRVKERLLEKWKDVVVAFSTGAVSGIISAIITGLLNMLIRTGKNIVRVIREGFLSLMKAIKTLLFPTEGMTSLEAAHEASKVFTTGLVVTGGILAGEAIATSLGGIPFAGTISTVIAGLISGLGSLFAVYMLDKLDAFGVNAADKHKFILGQLEPNIEVNIEKIELIVSRLELRYEKPI